MIMSKPMSARAGIPKSANIGQTGMENSSRFPTYKVKGVNTKTFATRMSERPSVLKTGFLPGGINVQHLDISWVRSSEAHPRVSLWSVIRRQTLAQ